MYSTSDLYVVAGLSVASGLHPDNITIKGGIAYCEFVDSALDQYVQMLENGALRVDVRALRIEHIALKKHVLALVDKKGKQIEASPH